METNGYIDLLTDGQTGAGGYIAVFDNDGICVDEVDTEEAEDAITEFDDIEPYIALVKSAAQQHGIFMVRDGNTRDEPFTLVEWEKVFRSEMNQYA